MPFLCNRLNMHALAEIKLFFFWFRDALTLRLRLAIPSAFSTLNNELTTVPFAILNSYNRGGQPMAHAPYVAQWLLKSGALHLFDDKPLLLTNFLLIFFFICPPPIFFGGKQNIWGREDLFFVFGSPPTLSVENKTSEGIGARRWATVPCLPPFGPVIRC